MAMEEPKQYPKPTNFDELYPGRFMKAGEFKGKKVTLTITDVSLEELGEGAEKKAKAVLSFKETQKKHVACKTNGICIREMFGKDLKTWIGKRVILFPSTWNGDDAIRVWGSPDIPADFETVVQLPRKRPIKMTMHRAVANGGGGGATKPAADQRADVAERDAEPPADWEPGSEG